MKKISADGIIELSRRKLLEIAIGVSSPEDIVLIVENEEIKLATLIGHWIGPVYATIRSGDGKKIIQLASIKGCENKVAYKVFNSDYDESELEV